MQLSNFYATFHTHICVQILLFYPIHLK